MVDPGDPIPPFNELGNLPSGVHVADIDALLFRFGESRSQRRGHLAKRLREFNEFARHCALQIYIDGSFITSKLAPNDIDILVVLPTEFLQNLPAVFRLQEFVNNYKIYKLHIFPLRRGVEDMDIAQLLAWFERDRDGNPKGIVRLERKHDQE